MGIAYLTLMFALSVACLVVLTIRFERQQNNYIFYLFISIVVTNFGHWLLGLSKSLEGAIIATKLSYVGSSFMPMFLFFALIRVCDLKVSIFIRGFFVSLSLFICFMAMTIGVSPIYYESIEYAVQGGVGNYVATFGWGHAVFNAMLALYMFVDVFAVCYAVLKHRAVSIKNIMALILIKLISVFSFLVARCMENDMIIMPLIYVLDQFVLLYICFNVKWYDISNCILESLERVENCGYVSFTSDGLYLGCNEKADKFFSELKQCRIDSQLSKNSGMNRLFGPLIDRLEKNEKIEPFEFSYHQRHYQCDVRVLPQIHGKNVYLFKIVDDTSVQLYINSLGQSNALLQKTIESNSYLVNSIQEQMIVGMAKMVESRDDYTGGHIKRTSDVVKILVDEMRKDRTLMYPNEFYSAVISAAPMHDLGKIAIDDQILRKTGKFNDEEIKTMRTHAERGAVIVENLLAEIDDPFFVQVAKNMAYYHHERWNGEGYPKGLSKENIPLEARIMAIADSYDALVSKRSYKQRVSFTEAYEIILDAMGKKFDPGLLKYFMGCQGLLRKYYMSNER